MNESTVAIAARLRDRALAHGYPSLSAAADETTSMDYPTFRADALEGLAALHAAAGDASPVAEHRGSGIDEETTAEFFDELMALAVRSLRG